MSLDVSLIAREPITKSGTGVFVRQNGATVELTPEQVAERWPDAPPAEVQEFSSNEVYSANITHNMSKMAQEAGIYEALWRPEEEGWKMAADLIEPLEKGLTALRANPIAMKVWNPENGWGSYEGLVDFVENYLVACREYPDTEIEVSR
jgi:hypothetical protein